MSFSKDLLGRMAALALVPMAGGCGPAAPGNAAVAQPPLVAADSTAPSAATAVATPTPGPLVAASGTRCPATLTGSAVASGARLLGIAGGAAIGLSSATVTANAPSAIAEDTSGMAEVEPEEGPQKSGVTVQVYDAEPSAEQPYTLVCRYGATRPPLLAEAVLLLPIAAGAHYVCTTELPQGASRRAVSAVCVREEK
ncbi:hypothetical protein [Sphingomonas sp. PB4P5]|uniref:hypothetical protein n=1 Tax=Parasphingomonas puruogangriensis TaxID=3096155 RepID=UPI002FCA01D4